MELRITPFFFAFLYVVRTDKLMQNQLELKNSNVRIETS